MKYILIVAMMLIGLSGFSQEKWRTLTLRSTTGFNIQGDFIFTPTANLFYELNEMKQHLKEFKKE